MTSGPLALLGGTPLRPEGQKPYNTIGEREKAAVLDVLDSGELSGFVASAGPEFRGGMQVQALEEAFRNHYGMKDLTYHVRAVCPKEQAFLACEEMR